MVEDLLNFAKKDALVEIRGPSEKNYNIMRYALTNAGKERASEALRRCEYIGPVPIPLETYQTQVQKQTITNEVIGIEQLKKATSHLVLSEEVVRRLGPASNSGRAILIYGAAGNGKTSIAEALANAFEQPVYVPYAIEADGQIIKIYDPSVHVAFPMNNGANGNTNPILLPHLQHDPRWVRCKRPYLISGGELTLEMLDLDFDPHSKYYEAPLQMKAIGGVFVIDDFGRQRVRPHELLNRWIFPLERKVDYLTLHTGKKFALLFDQLVIFATNFPPEELMDPAQLRRIHYKMKVNPPTARRVQGDLPAHLRLVRLGVFRRDHGLFIQYVLSQAQNSVRGISSQVYCRARDRVVQLSRHSAADFASIARRFPRGHGDPAQLAGSRVTFDG